MAMARDRALPDVFAVVRGKSGVPVASLWVTAGVAAIVQVSVPNLASAGAASSLIFLITFALVHGIAILVRRRSIRRPPPFRTPWFPLVPVLGGAACLSLAVYQGVAVPSAGGIVLGWLMAGVLLFLGWFAHGARLADDSDAARDPELMTLRGRSPLILVPVANPGHAAGLVAMANALAPPGVGRVLLLSVVVAPRGWNPEEDDTPLRNAQAVLGASIAAAASRGHMPEALTTVAADPWSEIERVAEVRRCEGLMLGLSRLDSDVAAGPLNRLLSRVECEAVVLRAPEGWSPGDTLRVLIPVGGRRDHDRLLVRMLSSLARTTTIAATVMKVLPASTSEERRVLAERGLKGRARDVGTRFPIEVRVVLDDDPVARIAAESESQDLLVLGTQRLSRHRRVFGDFAIAVARATDTPLMLIARRN